MKKIKLWWAIFVYQTFGKLKRELAYRKRIKELRKQDPFIY